MSREAFDDPGADVPRDPLVEWANPYHAEFGPDGDIAPPPWAIIAAEERGRVRWEQRAALIRRLKSMRAGGLGNRDIAERLGLRRGLVANYIRKP